MPPGHIIRNPNGVQPSALILVAFVFLVGVPNGKKIVFGAFQCWLAYKLFSYVRRGKAAAAPVQQSSKTYLHSGGRVVVAAPPPPSKPVTRATIIFFGCVGGACVRAAGEELLKLLPPMPLQQQQQLIFQHLPMAAMAVLGVTSRALLRASGTYVGVVAAGLVVRPQVGSSRGVFLAALCACYFAELHADLVYFQVLLPTLLMALGVFAERIAFSPLTFPVVRMLLSAGAAYVALERSAVPMDINAGKAARRVRGIATLALVLSASAAAFILPNPRRVNEAMELRRLLERGELMTACMRLRDHTYASFAYDGYRSSSGGSAPPGAPIPPDEMERRASAVLGVSVGTAWADVKKAYREKALESHPDKLRSQLGREPTEEELAETTRRFKEVQEAHDTLEEMHVQGRERAPGRDEL